MDTTINEYLKAKNIVDDFEAKLKSYQEYKDRPDGIKMSTRIEDALDILDYDFSNRVKNLLGWSEIYIVSDLFGMCFHQYRGFRNMGEKSLDDIKILYKMLNINLPN